MSTITTVGDGDTGVAARNKINQNFANLNGDKLEGLGANVAVTINDTTGGFLDDKIVAGDGITTSVLGGGGDEDLQISLEKHFLSLASTGIYSGGGLSIGATTGTFDITEGEGFL